MINTIPCSISDFHTGKLEMKNQPKILTYFNIETSYGWIKIPIWEFYNNNNNNKNKIKNTWTFHRVSKMHQYSKLYFIFITWDR